MTGYVRFFSCSNSILNNPAASYVRHRKVYADLGLPEPPKKPANAYLRYLTDSLDGLKLNVEQRKEKYREQAVAWKQLDSTTRDRYQNNFKNEQVSDDVQQSRTSWHGKLQMNTLFWVCIDSG